MMPVTHTPARDGSHLPFLFDSSERDPGSGSAPGPGGRPGGRPGNRPGKKGAAKKASAKKSSTKKKK